ncbi:hypothetical protein PE066_12135 [Ramlibacter tataouinensis]|uniref:hypothetical protein n=1 Tax=Ramlibacter tataouinensis TaxID=94132 RepID=UPI0022F3F683|nr:hypothetical protein [Ramlibacter tataouinensis]WBY00227.1 hypothetical protein PE066_12135 [Ramlibacter tataouinensis]
MNIRARAPAAQDFPVLRLGLAGFSPAEEEGIRAALREPAPGLLWEIVPLADADAWCVNGVRAQPLGDGTVRIAPGLPSSRSIRVDPRAVDCPVVFARLPASPGFRPQCVFDPEQPATIAAMLRWLEGRLRPIVVQFHVARHIAVAEPDLRACSWHVTLEGRLCAVVNQRSGIGVWALADPAALPNARWSRRPESANAIPAHFVTTDFSQLMWQYATRTSRDCLPPHYRTQPLFLRRPPRLPARTLDDTSLLLVRELGHACAGFAELRERTGLGEAALARHLGALYMVGAITADPRRASVPRAVLDAANSSGFAPATVLPATARTLGMTVKLIIGTPGNTAAAG